jgi:class 3 adenylate cyclase
MSDIQKTCGRLLEYGVFQALGVTGYDTGDGCRGLCTTTPHPFTTTQGIPLTVYGTPHPSTAAIVSLVHDETVLRRQLAKENLRQYKEQAMVLRAMAGFLEQMGQPLDVFLSHLFAYTPPCRYQAVLDKEGVICAKGTPVFDTPCPGAGMYQDTQGSRLVLPFAGYSPFRLVLERDTTEPPFTSIDERLMVLLVQIASMITEQLKLRQNQQLLSRYFPKGMADYLLSNFPEATAGREVEATILFADIRGFTRMTRRLGARETVQFLNKYFQVVVEVVRTHGGVIDKFLGDGVLCVFGLPFPKSDDTERAFGAAQAILAALPALSVDLGQPLSVGMAISRGHIISGNIGSQTRMDFTVIGEPVNAAAKAQLKTRKLTPPLLLTQAAYRALPEIVQNQMVKQGRLWHWVPNLEGHSI